MCSSNCFSCFLSYSTHVEQTSPHLISSGTLLSQHRLSLSPSLSPSLLKLQQWNMEHNANQPLQHPPHSHLLTQTEKKTPSNETLRSPKRKECLSFLLFYVSVFAKLSLSYHVIFPQVLFRELLCHLSCKPGSSLD